MLAGAFSRRVAPSLNAPGMASSRAKAQVQRDAATVMLMEQKIVITRTKNMSARPPPGLPITMWNT